MTTAEDISVPDDIESLIWDKDHGVHPMPIPEIVRLHNWQVFEAYRRGQASITAGSLRAEDK
jgi:hypothetical protein